jgi:hypothetical protein
MRSRRGQRSRWCRVAAPVLSAGAGGCASNVTDAEPSGASAPSTATIRPEHLSWLETELDLLEPLGEPLYLSNRLGAPASPPPIR